MKPGGVRGTALWAPARRRARRGLAPLASLAVIVAIPSLARAGNTVHPRTPVQWPDGACIRTVDRSVDPVFHIEYTIPFEDTNLTADELPDSRRHQFIALCRQYDRQTGLPTYVSEQDLARTIDAGLTEPSVDDDPDATLERAPGWDGCWSRVNADDDRRPITFEAAEAGVDWDTSEVAPGVYQLVGHTFEPPVNLWRLAPYAVRVVDDPSANIGPAAVLADVPQVVSHDEPVRLTPCIHAPAGSELRVLWALADPDPVFEAAQSAVYDGEAATLDFVPPAESWGQGILLAVEVEDPNGQVVRTHARQEVIVIAPDDGSGDDGGDDGSADDDGATDGGDPPAAEGGTEPLAGCAVEAVPAGPDRPGLLAGLTIFMLGAGGARRGLRTRWPRPSRKTGTR